MAGACKRPTWTLGKLKQHESKPFSTFGAHAPKLDLKWRIASPLARQVSFSRFPDVVIHGAKKGTCKRQALKRCQAVRWMGLTKTVLEPSAQRDSWFFLFPFLPMEACPQLRITSSHLQWKRHCPANQVLDTRRVGILHGQFSPNCASHSEQLVDRRSDWQFNLFVARWSKLD